MTYVTLPTNGSFYGDEFSEGELNDAIENNRQALISMGYKYHSEFAASTDYAQEIWVEEDSNKISVRWDGLQPKVEDMDGNELDMADFDIFQGVN